MKKSILLGSLTCSILLANELVVLPMNPNELSVENGGTLSAVDAYKNGVGAIIAAKAELKIDNSPMNNLVFKYGEEAKTNNKDLKTFVLGNQSADDKDLTYANKLSTGIASSVIPLDGTACDDHNPQTINDIYVNGSCIGNNVEGQSCNDGNPDSVNDKYTNGTCAGVVPTSCSNLKSLVPSTISGIYKLDADNNPATATVSLYCEMSLAGGGWTQLQVVNTSFSTNISSYNRNMFTPIISNDYGLSYTKFMLVNNTSTGGSFIDWVNDSSAWGSSAIDAQLMDVRFTDDTFAYLLSIRDTTLSDSGMVRPCLNNFTTTNTCHNVYVGNIPSGKRLKNFWDDEAYRATIGLTDYTNINTDNFRFYVYVK